MEIIFTKGNAKYGHLKCVRNNGTFTETQIPEQGAHKLRPLTRRNT